MGYNPRICQAGQEEPELVDDKTSAPHATRRPQVGDPMPDLTLRTLDGEPFQLSHLHGKRALIFMWASW